jgi:hypothetical protein
MPFSKELELLVGALSWLEGRWKGPGSTTGERDYFWICNNTQPYSLLVFTGFVLLPFKYETHIEIRR